MKLTHRVGLLAGVALTLSLTLTACGESGADGADGASDGVGATAPPVPPALGAPAGQVTGLGLVIDQGGGTELCLGAIAESYPPQCEGIPLAGWTWAGRSDFEDANGVKFATYAVTGTFDGTTLTVTEEPISGALYDPMPDPLAGRALSTRCDAPAEGWVVVNKARANAAALARAEETALSLDGYVAHWSDLFTMLEALPTEAEPGVADDLGGQSGDALNVILNVQVKGDVAEATTRLRTVWGGALCVSKPQHTQRQLDDVAAALMEADGVTSAFAQYDRVIVEVVYDDGALQAYVDETYGEDAVVVMSGLRAVS